MIYQRKLQGITEKYFGKLLQVTVCMMDDNKQRVTLKYIDEFKCVYEYIMIIDEENNKVEFIKNGNSSYMKSLPHKIINISEFEQEILTNLREVF